MVVYYLRMSHDIIVKNKHGLGAVLGSSGLGACVIGSFESIEMNPSIQPVSRNIFLLVSSNCAYRTPISIGQTRRRYGALVSQMPGHGRCRVFSGPRLYEGRGKENEMRDAR